VNIKEYILSGIIESYVLGIATDQDKEEFERMCALHPEVAAAREAFELSLEKIAIQDAVDPPAELKEKIWQVLGPGQTELNRISASSPKESKVHSLNWLKFAIAACLILLAGSLYWNVSLYNKKNQLESINQKLENDINNYATKMGEMENDAKALQNPNIKMAALQGTQHSPQSFATVYWDTTSKDVYLMINNLPRPASDKQYQLWALLDGKPIDLGVIEMKQEKMIPMYRMKNANKVQAFAITLEKKGGSNSPLGEMYVLGKL
jgi:anti-sigma-K factor RskA